MERSRRTFSLPPVAESVSRTHPAPNCHILWDPISQALVSTGALAPLGPRILPNAGGRLWGELASLSPGVGWLLPHREGGSDSHNHSPVDAKVWNSQIAFSQDWSCLITELTASLSASVDLVAGSENLFSLTKLITVGSRSPGASPNPHQHTLSRAFPLPLVPLGSLGLPVPCSFLPSYHPSSSWASALKAGIWAEVGASQTGALTEAARALTGSPVSGHKCPRHVGGGHTAEAAQELQLPAHPWPR